MRIFVFALWSIRFYEMDGETRYALATGSMLLHILSSTINSAINNAIN